MSPTKNSRFVAGTVKCSDCGKITRDTGKGESNLKLCAGCIDAQEWANSISDGDCTLDDVPVDLRERVESYL